MTISASTSHDNTRAIFTVRQFSERNPAFTELAVRNLIFKASRAPGNGLIEAGAIVRIGRKVLIDEVAFFKWVDGYKSDGGEK